MIDNHELLFVVDDENNPLTPLPRNIVHTEGHWHRTSHIWIINDKKEILCQKRSLLKDSNPGFWEPFFGGHMGPKSDYASNALAELDEELGIKVDKNNLQSFTVYKSYKGKEFQGVFYILWNGSIQELRLEIEEIDEVAWRSLSELEQIVDAKTKGWSIMGYTQLLLNHIKTTL
jgi:8-oxo-dGTP diphosphatase